MLLNCHTFYSFCYGTLTIDELLNEIQARGYDSFVLTDINNTSACLETIRRANERGMKPIAGVDFRNGIQQKYVGIARNNEGFKELNEHLSAHLHVAKKIEDQAPEFNHAYIIYPMQAYTERPLRENEFIGVSLNDLQRLPSSPSKSMAHKMVALQPTTFIHKKHFNAHRLLRAIDKNTLLSKLPLSEQSVPDAIIVTKEKMYEAYSAFPSIIKNTEHILRDCNIGFVYGKLANKNRKNFTDSPSNDLQMLRSEAEKGLRYRYPHPSQQVLDRMEKELQVIAQMGFASYFLINWDIVRYARSKGYYYVGRGSGANSMVAYLMNITDVDPIDLDLYFERFINPFRTNAPDFDIDFSWLDRDDITRYIFDKYGNKHTALLGSYATFQSDGVVRELGKVFGLPPGEIDKLQSAHKETSTIDSIGKLVLQY
ncbi:MAG TPA: PHP domain-containing protein, partial [Bacteroidia bacterium]|nr:PHP domain-containing protein [Bacteroidia bacterium]